MRARLAGNKLNPRYTLEWAGTPESREQMMEQSDELRPCPFCGSGALCDFPDAYTTWQIMCDNNNCPVDLWVWGFSSREAAIAAWNTRADDGLREALQMTERPEKVKA